MPFKEVNKVLEDLKSKMVFQHYRYMHCLALQIHVLFSIIDTCIACYVSMHIEGIYVIF